MQILSKVSFVWVCTLIETEKKYFVIYVTKINLKKIFRIKEVNFVQWQMHFKMSVL